MKLINRDRIEQLNSTFGELRDHRSAVCYGHILEVNSYDEVHTVEVYDAPDVCNVTDAPNTLGHLKLYSAYEFTDERAAIRFWCDLMYDRAVDHAQ